MPRRRVRSGVGFSAVVVACFVTTGPASGFVASIPLRRIDATAYITASTTMSAESPVTRAQVLGTIPAAIWGAMILGTVEPATAAIPTAEDYAFGSGSKKRPAGASTPTRPESSADDCPDCSLLARRQRTAAAAPSSSSSPKSPEQLKRPEMKDDLSAPVPKSSVNPNNPAEVVRAVSGELDLMQALVNKERWGDALTRLRSYPLTTLKSPTLGMGSVGDVARALGVDKSKAADILEASMEAGLTLREVEDIVFSNTRTLEFFNSADFKQVEDLARNRKPTDLTEPLQLLADTKRLVEGVSELIGASDASAR